MAAKSQWASSGHPASSGSWEERKIQYAQAAAGWNIKAYFDMGTPRESNHVKLKAVHD